MGHSFSKSTPAPAPAPEPLPLPWRVVSEMTAAYEVAQRRPTRPIRPEPHAIPIAPASPLLPRLLSPPPFQPLDSRARLPPRSFRRLATAPDYSAEFESRNSWRDSVDSDDSDESDEFAVLPDDRARNLPGTTPPPSSSLQSRQPRPHASNSNLSTARQPRPRASQPNFSHPRQSPLTTPSSLAPRARASLQNLSKSRQSRPSRHIPPSVREEALVPPTTQECTVCVEEKPLKEFPKITERCKHQPSTCLNCVREWVKSELTALTWNKLKCCGAGCKATLSHADMKRVATKELFEKYDHFSMLSVLSTMPDFRWCLSRRCKSGQIHITGTEGPIFRCVSCSAKACVVHNVPWHEGLTCREYDYSKNPRLKKKEEQASERAVKELTKRCPGKGCNAPIERNGGCDHMTCRKCLHQFCWLCMADYSLIRKKGNTAHKAWCKLHSNNLPS